MRNRIILISLALMGLVAVMSAGCSKATDPDGDDTQPLPIIPDVQDATGNSPDMAIVDWVTSDFSDPAVAAKYARADILILHTQYLWGKDQYAGQLDRIRAFNPDIKIIGYVESKTCRVGWSRWTRDQHAFKHDWFEAMKPYWSYTTKGDTLFDWEDAVVVDFLDPECRARMIQIIQYYNESSGNRFDGVFWDYFPPDLFIAFHVRDRVEGDPDMDGDGIIHWEDEDEIAAFQAAQEALVLETRATMGEDFIQIFNGGRAHRDSNFAKLSDGIFIERFPQMTYWDSDNMRQALDPEEPNDIWAMCSWPRTEAGGPWVIMSNKAPVTFMNDKGEWIEYDFADINRVVALMSDALPVYQSENRRLYGWPEVELSLGEALGPPVANGDAMYREFENGRVELTWTSGAYPLPFDFEIVQDGVLVQALNYPSHIP